MMSRKMIVIFMQKICILLFFKIYKIHMILWGEVTILHDKFIQIDCVF